MKDAGAEEEVEEEKLEWEEAEKEVIKEKLTFCFNNMFLS